jgi:hypothetical protein
MIIHNISFIDIFNIGIFGFVIGAFETTTNLVYLLSNNYILSKKQHRMELPDEVTDTEIRTKVIQMFCLGISLLLIATVSLLINPLYFVLASGVLFASGAIDYLRFRKSRIFLIWLVVREKGECYFSEIGCAQ